MERNKKKKKRKSYKKDNLLFENYIAHFAQKNIVSLFCALFEIQV